ncbi:DUF3152 domain-containing protein [Flexivirga alba]|uniref:DUF3152 domain-containing protein n=1 Tax=Flexivirga alba TaxID=702742 RepID=A0ABW2AHL4_9MICO
MQGSYSPRTVRLVRTIVITAVLLTMLSALSGYLLHGRGQSAGASSASASDTAAPTPGTQETASATPTTATPTASTPTKPSGSASPTAKSTPRQSASSKPVVVPANGNGHFSPALVPQTTTAKTGRIVTYRLNIEGGMHADPKAVASTLGAALLDRRGWQGVDQVRFVQVSPTQLAKGAKAQLTISLASPHQVDKLCAPLPTHGGTSCATGQHVILNYKLWMRGVSYFKGQLAAYREYMVNHEVGHTLGHGHLLCSKPGAYAPVMQQQTLGLQGCKAWPWPKRPDSHGKA